MGLADETKRVVGEFDLSDNDLNRHVKEFLRQMGMFPIDSLPVTTKLLPAWVHCVVIDAYRANILFFQTDEGLSKDGTSLQQIPTYVTGVPNGTEKVQ